MLSHLQYVGAFVSANCIRLCQPIQLHISGCIFVRLKNTSLEPLVSDTRLPAYVSSALHEHGGEPIIAHRLHVVLCQCTVLDIHALTRACGPIS